MNSSTSNKSNKRRESWHQSETKQSAKKVEELTKANILREVKYQTWVSNLVIVKKDEGRWNWCIDFTDINKACPKDCYPLPESDQKVETFSKFRLKCFLDAYKGYHQIQMAEGDEEKTSFFTRKWVFCNRRMPFGLKNAGATYQRLIDKVFGNQIRRNLEVYVNDIVIKSDSEEGMLVDIQETFDKLRAINIWLYPKSVLSVLKRDRFWGISSQNKESKTTP
ncbi:reverse transcriptase domain-containing protein [Tanacetum coccineum]